MTILRNSSFFNVLADESRPLVDYLQVYRKELCGVSGYAARQENLALLMQSDGYTQMTPKQIEEWQSEELVFLSESTKIRNIIYGHLNSYFEQIQSDPIFYGINAAVLVYRDLYRHIKDELNLDPVVTERINDYLLKTETETREFLESIRNLFKEYPSLYNAYEFTNPRFLMECTDYRRYYAIIFNGIGQDLNKMDSMWKNVEVLLKDCKKLAQKVYAPGINELTTLFKGTKYTFGSTSFKQKYPLAEKSIRQILGSKETKQIGVK